MTTAVAPRRVPASTNEVFPASRQRIRGRQKSSVVCNRLARARDQDLFSQQACYVLHQENHRCLILVYEQRGVPSDSVNNVIEEKQPFLFDWSCVGRHCQDSTTSRSCEFCVTSGRASSAPSPASISPTERRTGCARSIVQKAWPYTTKQAKETLPPRAPKPEKVSRLTQLHKTFTTFIVSSTKILAEPSKRLSLRHPVGEKENPSSVILGRAGTLTWSPYDKCGKILPVNLDKLLQVTFRQTCKR